MTELDGKVALVTGGATGIGRAAAALFVAEGARVFITGRRQAELDEAAADIGATAIRGDIADLNDLDAIATRISEETGRLDVLFANAGGGELSPITTLTPESFDRVFGTNVRGTAFTVQKMLPLMPDGASIVVTGSTSASRGNLGFGSYSASKAAVRQFARVWAAELAPRRIRVNVLVPGPTDTPGLRGGFPGGQEQVPAILSQLAASTPLNRMADPAEIAQAALFLAGARSSYMTGGELFADGGEVQVFPAA